MAKDALSQDQIDQLLSGAGPSPAPAPSGAALECDPQPYDFRRPHRVSKERLRALEAMYSRLTKALEGWLVSRLRGSVEIELLGVEEFSFGEFALSLPTPCASFIFDIEDAGEQRAVIDIGHEFAYFAVDRLFGGSGRPSMPDRALTPMERMAVRSIAERIAAHVSEIWADYVPLRFSMVGFESSPEILQPMSREEPVLVASAEVAIGEHRSTILICLPFAVLEKFFVSASTKRIKTASGPAHERTLARRVAEASLRATRVPLAARLPAFQLSMRALAGLEAGSVVATRIPSETRIVVTVGGQARFLAVPGRRGRALAVKIVDVTHANGLASRAGDTEEEES